jgi:hypothetical protein
MSRLSMGGVAAANAAAAAASAAASIAPVQDFALDNATDVKLTS